MEGFESEYWGTILEILDWKKDVAAAGRWGEKDGADVHADVENGEEVKILFDGCGEGESDMHGEGSEELRRRLENVKSPQGKLLWKAEVIQT